MGMFQFFPTGTGSKETNGLAKIAAKPHSTRRGSLSSRLRYSSHMHEMLDDNSTRRSLASARPIMFETYSNHHLVPSNPIIAHHKYNYCEPPAVNEVIVGSPRESFSVTRAHHKTFYIPQPDITENTQEMEIEKIVAHHKNNYELVTDNTVNTNNEPTYTWAGRKWHHRTLYGQYNFEKGESSENFSPRKGHHKFNYEPQI